MPSGKVDKNVDIGGILEGEVMGYIWTGSAWIAVLGRSDGAALIQTDPPSGSVGDGIVACAAADTWYQVPNSGDVPDKDYLLVVVRENSAGTIRWSWSNGGVPSVTNGVKLITQFALLMKANAVLYIGSSILGDDVNYTYKGMIA